MACQCVALDADGKARRLRLEPHHVSVDRRADDAAAPVALHAERRFHAPLQGYLQPEVVARWRDAGRDRRAIADVSQPHPREIDAVVAHFEVVDDARRTFQVELDGARGRNARALSKSRLYFINPLVSVLMGVLVLGERLRRLQWVAIGIAAVAVVALTVEYGRPPWVALILAFSFGSYGLAKKKADAGAVESLVFETLVVSPVAIGYLVFLAAHGRLDLRRQRRLARRCWWSAPASITVIPLLCFGGAATRIPLSHPRA